MPARFNLERFILYLSITVVYVSFWVHNDLAQYPGNFSRSLINNLWQVVYVMGIHFAYFAWIVPFVTSRKDHRIVIIIASVLIHLTVFVFGLYTWRELGMLLEIYHPFKVYSGFGSKLSAIVIFTPGTFLIFAFFKLFYDYTQLKYEGQRVRLEKKQAELLFLKSQINPHFLFNTLNNIYSLSQYQPQLVSESVMRLSKILRYVLYETSNEFVSVDKEIKILTDYIDLEKLRYTENVTIDFTHNIEDLSETVPPLLLLPLVENAFKHGVSQSRGKRFVDVIFSLRKRQLHFVVRNSSFASRDYEESKDNIGLSNLRRRLALLYKEFDFVAGQKDNVFTVELKINLSSHV